MKILCFGDSNTYGYDPRSYLGDRYQACDRWPDILATKTGYTVINEGENGRLIPRDSSAMLLLNSLAPIDLLIIMLGTNDLLCNGSVKEISTRMKTFLIPLQKKCQQILLIPPAMKRGAWVDSDTLLTKSLALSKEYQSIAKELNILFMDITQIHPQLTFDGVHFTESDHHTIADCIIHLIQKNQ